MADDEHGKPSRTGRKNKQQELNVTPLPSSEKAIAVALDDGSGSDGVPHITATGRGAVAEQILNVAFERGIKVRQDADLAEILAKFDIDSPIPVEALAAVAEILSYVYLSNNKQADETPAEQVPNPTEDKKV